MDRTDEFRTLLGSRGGDLRAPSSQTAAGADSDQGARSGFNAEAAKIGQEIHRAQLKLDELGKLVRQKGVFSHTTSRVGAIADNIANDISVLTATVDRFSASGRDASHPQMRQYADALVQTLRQRLAEIVRGLQEVSELRVRMMKEQESRRNRFSLAPSISSQIASSGGYAPVNTDDPESGGIVAEQAVAQYHTSRLTSVQGIQRTIAELGQIFSRMATTLQQQEEMVSRIDSHIEAADVHIKEGTNQLMIYYNSISSNRKLILKIFLILILFAIIMAVTS